MESPDSWNLLTASLAVCDLGAPFSVWAFLVIQGLVWDMPGDGEAFATSLPSPSDMSESMVPPREPLWLALAASRAAGFLIRETAVERDLVSQTHSAVEFPAAPQFTHRVTTSIFPIACVQASWPKTAGQPPSSG
jgi:hypothetical protein